MEVTIRVNGLTKIFEAPVRLENTREKISNFFRPQVQKICAIDNVNFECLEGQIIGYLGPNGAGKSTTLKCLTGIIHPTSGSCKVLGMIPGEKRGTFYKKIGTMFGQRSMLFWDLSVRDTMLLYKEIYNLDLTEFTRNLTELSQGLGVQDLLDRPVRKLSFGQRVRCDLVAALLHHPQVIFLDEPTVGVDLEGKRMLRTFLNSYKEEKKATVILTTHQLDDVEAVCDRILLINKGKLLFDGSLSELQYSYVTNRTISANVVFVRDEPAYAALLSKYAGIQNVRLELTVPREHATDVVTRLIQIAEIRDLAIDTPRLETVIAQWY